MKSNVYSCIKWFSCSLFFLIFSGCATTNDPAKGGFISGVAALANGAYDDRLEQKEYTLEEERQRSNELRYQANKSKQDRAAAEQELAAIQTRYEMLNHQMEELRTQVNAARRTKNLDERKYRQLLSETEALEKQMRLSFTSPTLSRQEKLQEINLLTHKKNSLEQALSTMAQ